MIVRPLLAAVAVAASVTGCTGDEAPPTTLPTLSTTPTPTATVPPPPPETEGEDSLAAAEFAKYYLELVALAYQRTDPEIIRPLSHDGCEGCSNFMEAVAELRDAMREVEGGEYVFDAAAAAPSPDQDYLVIINYRRKATRLLDADGNLVKEEPAVPATTSQMRVVRDSGRWLVYGYRLVPT